MGQIPLTQVLSSPLEGGWGPDMFGMKERGKGGREERGWDQNPCPRGKRERQRGMVKMHSSVSCSNLLTDPTDLQDNTALPWSFIQLAVTVVGC